MSGKTEYKRAKARADEWFSKFIRLRDCLETTGTPEYGLCRTCRARKAFEELHNGHYIPGRYDSIRFREDVGHIQCNRCNGKQFLNGNMVAYTPFMVRRYGQEHVNRLWQIARETVQYKSTDYREFAKFWREKYNELKEAYRKGEYRPGDWCSVDLKLKVKL